MLHAILDSTFNAIMFHATFYSTNVPCSMLDLMFHAMFLFNVPFNVGFNVPVNVGFNVPFNVPFNVGFNVPFNVPFNVGFNVPFNVGFNVPFNVGFNVPFNVGFNVPFNAGFNIPFNAMFHASFCSILDLTLDSIFHAMFHIQSGLAEFAMFDHSIVLECGCQYIIQVPCHTLGITRHTLEVLLYA